jgi:hypothetical protein
MTPFGVASGLRSFETALKSLIGKLTADCIGDNTRFTTGQHYFGANKLPLETYTERGMIRPHSGREDPTEEAPEPTPQSEDSEA